MNEFETTIELAGEPMAATVIFERCPFDGHPVICEVIAAKRDIVSELAKKDLSAIEAAIEAETEAAITENRIDQADDRWLYRRAA